jgi:thymidylate synthase (FAD)
MKEDVKLVWVTPAAEKHIMYTARVSNPKNQDSENTKLLEYCFKHKHFSIFEMASMCIEINTSRSIARQILRHRSFSFQEYCITGDSLITTVQPNGNPNYIPIEKLYKRQKHKNYKDLLLRVYDEKKKEFTTAKYLEVFKNGVKPVYKVYFEDGKTITCTKEHRFLTKRGFLPLEEALGLEIVGNTVTQKNPMLLATNGQPCYQSYEWLSEAKRRSIESGKGVQGIADEAGVSYHTIRKWLKRLKLNFSRKEVAQYNEIWNKGKTGYKIKPRTREQRDHMRAITPRGKDHHAYKGGGASERKAIANYFNSYRKDIFKKFNYTCQLCNKPFNYYDGKIDLHHIKEVSLFPELARDIDNVIPVHRKCHMEYHGKTYNYKETRRGHKGNTLAPRFKKIVKVEYVGERETYDIHVDHDSHNYVANKIVVHNSQRYSDLSSLEASMIVNEARLQDTKNRQNSIETDDTELQDWFTKAQEEVWSVAIDNYELALRSGIAKEQARVLLPEGLTTSRMYMTGTIRSWIHYCQLRCGNGTQKEHIEIAKQVRKILLENIPSLDKLLG